MGISESEFRAACNFQVPFGKHRGKTLNEVAMDDEGLRYLTWMAGLVDLRGTTRHALDTFLRWPAVAKDLVMLEEKKRSKQHQDQGEGIQY